MTSNEHAPEQTKAPGAAFVRVGQFARRFWLGRLWLQRAWLRRSVLGLLGSLAALVLFVAFALPPIVIAQAERAAEQKLHRHLSIESIRVNPFTLAASVQGVRLMEADGATVFVSFERLDVRVSPASLVYLAPVIREVHLVRPYVHLARTAPNQYSTDDLVAALPPGAPTPANETAPPRFAVHNIHVDGGRLVFDDLPEKAQQVVSELTLGIPFVSSFVAEEEVFVEPHLRALINGAPLQVSGDALPFAPTREAAVNLDFDDIDLTRYLEYLPGALPFRLPSARLDLHLKASVHLPKGEAPKVRLAGKATFKALELRTVDGKLLLKLSELELALAQANLPSGQLDAAVTVNRAGRLSVVGSAGLAPLHADLSVHVDDLDLLPVQPLFSDRVNVRVTRAGLAAKGQLRLDQQPGGALKGEFLGDATLARLATLDAVSSTDFVSWDTLALRGLRVQLSPLAVRMDEVALRNFFARVIIDPTGRINLQDIVRGQSEAKRSLTEAATGQGAAEAGGPVAVPAPQTGAPSAPASAGPPIAIGKFVLEKGHVRFSDNFIKPRYSADLMGLGGTVTGLSSDPASAAQIDLHGQVNRAPLLIGGRINPLRRDLSLDVKASVHDMELAPLTTYSSKYVGYRIERGKLSFDVAYQLENRQLHAENRLVLDQLTFGEKVESASATTLPVMLAVALLKDRNGVIDINLPIGGSLDDPDFSVGGIIVKVLINLVTKAVTAPFALLGRLFGGGEELSWLDFEPGQSAVTPAAEPKLKSLAAALADRPALKLDITGWVDPEADREALRETRVQGKLRALKRQDLAARGTLVSNAEVVVTPAEAPELVKRAYEAEVEAKTRPAGAVGGTPFALRAEAAAAAKKPQLTQQQMEQALRAAQQISDDDLRALGNRRAQEVEQWLKVIGMVPEERLSLVAAQITALEEAPAGAAPEAAPAPTETAAAAAPAPAPARSASRVEFALH